MRFPGHGVISYAMPKITIVEYDGEAHELDAEPGSTVMETALHGGVSSIIAQCGGSCSCATCLVVVDDAWVGRLEPPTLEELDQLESAGDAGPSSRLSCQIKVTPDLDGLRLRTPAHQGR
jgi:2Fe-2S ferredoxin